jgi:phosphatidylglycerophosphatase A
MWCGVWWDGERLPRASSSIIRRRRLFASGEAFCRSSGPRFHHVGSAVIQFAGMSPAQTAASQPIPPTPRWFDPAVLLATCGGLGMIGFAPGTFGAAVGVLITLACGRLSLPPVAEAGLLVAINLIGIPACTRAARVLGRGKDPGVIVYDEAASLPLAALVVPAAARTPAVLVALFVLHRLFDITKPFPCRQLERLPAGLGIMADDWGAAAYVAVCLVIGRWLGWL